MPHYAVPLEDVLKLITKLRKCVIENVSGDILEDGDFWDEWLDICEGFDLNAISEYFQERYPALEEQTA